MWITTKFDAHPQQGDGESFCLSPTSIVDRLGSGGFELDVRFFDTETTRQIEARFSSVRMTMPMDVVFGLDRVGVPEKEITYLVEQRDAIDEMLRQLGRRDG